MADFPKYIRIDVTGPDKNGHVNAELTPDNNVKPIVTAHWQERYEHRWKKIEGTDKIDNFAGVDYGFHNGPLCVKCGLSFCEHCEPEKFSSSCPVPHYKCSVCGYESDTKTPFCANCGAEMRAANDRHYGDEGRTGNARPYDGGEGD